MGDRTSGHNSAGQKDDSSRPVYRIQDRSRLRSHTPTPKPAVKKAIAPGNTDIIPVKPSPTKMTRKQSHVRIKSLSPEVVQVFPAEQHSHAEDVPSKTKSIKQRILSNKLSITIQTPKLQTMMVGMAFVVFAAGLFVSLQAFMVNNDAKAQVSALQEKADDNSDDENSNSSIPSEKDPGTGGKPYQTAPNVPKYIKISKIGVNARIKAMGVDSENTLKAPGNIYEAGWYNASARPGDAGSLGAMLIDGHVHGPTKPGVFVGLKKLVGGDIIQIVRGDNRVFTYKVMNVQNYDADKMDMGKMLTSVQPGQPGLNLITCGGKYDKKTGEYEERTAVFAVLLP